MVAAISRVVLITVDSLRYDRLGCGGNHNPCSPALDRLAGSGISCSRAYAHGFCSQLSYPSIFTSTLPLDCGGYDRGILMRPRSLPEVMQENGFTTVAFSCDPMLHGYYGYPRGFDEFHDLSAHGAFWDSLSDNYLDYYRGLRERGVIADAEYRDSVGALLEGVLDYLGQVEGSRGQRAAACDDRARDREALRERARTRLNALRQGGAPAGARGLAQDLVRRAARGARAVLKRGRPEDSLFQRFGPLASRFGVDPARLRGRFWSRLYRSAADQLGSVKQWLGAHPQPCSFIWVCLNDVHEGYASSSVWSASMGRRGARIARARPEEWPYLLYDESVAYVDRAIGDFVAFLSVAGLLDSTLVVVCADHGQRVGSRDGATGMASAGAFRFAEHIAHVPLLFSHPSLPPRVVEQPCGLIDLAPTILDLLGMAPEPAFRGRPVYASAGPERQHVLLENVGGGPCDLRHKPPRVCVIGERHKLIWAEGEPEELHDYGSRQGVATTGDAVLGTMRSMAMDRRSAVLAAERRL